jgi:predicted nucleic acid-binding protein
MVYGAYKSIRSAHFISRLNDLVWANLQKLPFDKGSAEIYGKIRAELEKKGTPQRIS